MSDKFEQYLLSELGYWRTDFVAPDGGPTDPLNHLTVKPNTTKEFKDIFDCTVEYARIHNGMEGYVEGEVIASEVSISEDDYDQSIPIPYKLEMESLPVGHFKQAEFHLTLCPEHSHRDLLEKLRNMGLMTIYMPKPRGIALIYTAQGEINVISELVDQTTQFLEKSGGAVKCDIKQEHIAKWWLSDDSLSLPPVVKTIRYSI